MEMFLCPFPDRSEYVNFEINSDGVYLSQYGSVRENRTFIKELTDIQANVSTNVTTDGWSLELFVPCSLISEVFGKEFTADKCTVRGNFTKCGDLTEYPHYGSFSALSTPDLGFHNPELFAVINIR